MTDRYQRGKIYRIVTPSNPELVYYGSTCEPTLAKRMASHRDHYKRYLNGKNVSCLTSFKIIEHDDCAIELVELFPCGSKDELHTREAFYIKNNDCVNNAVPCRRGDEAKEAYKQTSKKWHEKNKDTIKVKRAENYKQNKEVINAKQKTYRDENKEKVHEAKKIEYEKHRDKYIERARQYNRDHKEEICEKNKLYREQHKDEINARRKLYREQNKEKIAEQRKRFREANKEKIAEKERLYRLKKKAEKEQ